MGPVAQGNRGTGKDSDATCKHKQGQNNLLTTRSRTHGHIRERGNEQQVGKNQLLIHAPLPHDRQ